MTEMDLHVEEIRTHVILLAQLKRNKIADATEIPMEEHIVDRMIRGVYDECKQMSLFLELNLFAIAKIGKKFRKLCKAAPTAIVDLVQDGVDTWASYGSYLEYKDMCTKQELVSSLRKKCEGLYCDAFRQSYPELTHAELHFDKDKHHQFKRTRLGLGLKFGMIVMLVCYFLKII